jgi:4-hydroxybenzoate polyprenyltransferase
VINYHWTNTDSSHHSDICDADIDKFSTRTAKRPLPFGRCSPRLAKMWFCLQLLVAITTMYTLLGVASWLAMLPCQALAAVYPLAKRHVPWPQFVLAPTVGWPVFAGWLSAQTKCGVVERVGVGICGMLFVLHAVWNIYYDTCYGLQDIVGDRKSGVGSLAQFLGVKYFEPFLCGTMMVCLGLFMWVAEQAGSSLFLKGMGIGVWALTVPFQFWALDFDDPSSGGRIMKFNVDLGMYITAMVLADFLVMN